MGVFTRQYQEKVDSIVTECYVYAPSDLSGGGQIKRVKIQRSLWDTGASVSLVSARVAKVLGLINLHRPGRRKSLPRPSGGEVFFSPKIWRLQ